MFGFFDIGVPSSLQSKLDNMNGGSGHIGAFVVGMIGALVAGPCSGPVLLSIITMIGQRGELMLGAVLMMVFSLGMGMIFLIAGAFSTTLIQPGMWMETVKKSFGLIMWAGAIYFAAPHLSDWVTALIAAAMLISTAVYIWPEAESYDSFWIKRTKKLYTFVGGLIGAYLLLSVLLTKGFIMPPLQLSTGSATAPASGVEWLSDEPAALKQAAAENKIVMLDFTADWCAACKELEHFTYPDSRVVALSKQMVPLMIDATKSGDPAVAALLEKYGVQGLPTVHFLKPNGEIIAGNTVTGFVDADAFLERMNAAMAALNAP